MASSSLLAGQPQPSDEMALGVLADTCTICCELPARPSQCTVPSCGHSFCVDCVLSWSAVRCVCPNCKTPFECLRVRRDVVTGIPLPDMDEAEVEVVVLRTASWVNVHPIEPVVEDIAAAFHVARLSPEESRREVERAALFTGVRTYACEEAEDAAEAMFWEHESRMYEGSYVDDDFLGRASPHRPRRSFGNRRHGVNGYMSSGHMVAVPTPVASSTTSNDDAASSSSSFAPNIKCSSVGQPDLAPGRQFQRKPPSSGGKRNKKVKKKSRAAAPAANDTCPENAQTEHLGTCDDEGENPPERALSESLSSPSQALSQNTPFSRQSR